MRAGSAQLQPIVFAIRYSLYSLYSLSNIRYSGFGFRYSGFGIRYSLFVIRYLIFATRYHSLRVIFVSVIRVHIRAQ